MTAKIVNLTEQFVAHKVDEILRSAPVPQFQSSHYPVLPETEIRERAIAQVVNRSRNYYIVVQDSSDDLAAKWERTMYSSAERECIESLIQDTILRLLEETKTSHSEWQEVSYSSQKEPSRWFG